MLYEASKFPACTADLALAACIIMHTPSPAPFFLVADVVCVAADLSAHICAACKDHRAREDDCDHLSCRRPHASADPFGAPARRVRPCELPCIREVELSLGSNRAAEHSQWASRA